MSDIIYNPWKSDVYSLALVLLDMAGLELHGSGPVEDRIEVIGESYEKLGNILRLMLEEKPEKRMDFIQLRQSHAVREYFGEVEEPKVGGLANFKFF
jgi:hypothetical protein